MAELSPSMFLRLALLRFSKCSIFFLTLGIPVAHTARGQQLAPRVIVADVNQSGGPVDHFFDLSVGSDYPGTLIRDDSQAQLKLTVDELGFRYIRFHAIFHDVLGTVRIENGKTVYNWSKIDQLYDDLLARHIRPFVELGFTPAALATSQNRIFYWQGNTSHPKPEGWHDLVDAYIRHIEERYGSDEVRTWFFEVWNEPNLSGFWEGGDENAYFELYDLTAKTIKSVAAELRVGGPSTAGAAWVPEFLDHVKQSGAAVDFVTTHTYGVEGGFLDEKGVGDTKMSSSPRASPHDSYIRSPYILTKLKASQGLVQGMSYWTYTDLFEEPGPPSAPFQGRFGLLNPQGIRKPAFFAYKYLHALQGKSLITPDPQAFLSTQDGGVRAVIWDFEQPAQKVSNRSFYTKLIPAHPAAPVTLQVMHLAPETNYVFKVYRAGYHANDAYSAYLEMGAPSELSAAQIAHLNELTRDVPETNQMMRTGLEGTIKFTVPMNSNDIVLITLQHIVIVKPKDTPDAN